MTGVMNMKARSHTPQSPLTMRLSSLFLAGLISATWSCDGDFADAPPIALAQDTQAAGFVARVRDALTQGRRPSADEVQELKRIDREYAETQEVHGILLAVLPALKDWDGLARLYERKSSLSIEDRIALAKIYANLADYAGLVDVLAPVSNERPNDTELNALLGRAYYILDRHELAARHLDAVWESLITAGRTEEIVFRAMIHFDGGEIERARSLLESSVEKHQDSVYLHNALARVLAAAGAEERAAEHARRAGELYAQVTTVEQRMMRSAARTQALNDAFAAGDWDGCHDLIHVMLPEADAAFREQLFGFLSGMYKNAGREAELPAALERARAFARDDP